MQRQGGGQVEMLSQKSEMGEGGGRNHPGQKEQWTRRVGALLHLAQQSFSKRETAFSEYGGFWKTDEHRVKEHQAA